MPSNNKFTAHGAVCFVTARTQFDLPFPATILINFFLWSILAKAKSIYNVKVCHFVFMANHLHLITVTDNPEHLCAFMGYVKRETAHLVNRLLGIPKRTLWCESNDDPKILTAKDVIKYIVYIYSNPVKARLVPSIDEYPGVSSWKMFINNNFSKSVRTYKRSQISKLSSASPSLEEQARYLQYIFRINKDNNKFKIDPWAWVKCFHELANTPIDKLKQTILIHLRKEEQEYQKTGSFVGAERLKSEPINKPHTPKKFGKKMICLCHDITLRVAFITWYKGQRDKARKAIAALNQGFTILDFPSGFFAPKGVLLSNWVEFPL